MMQLNDDLNMFNKTQQMVAVYDMFSNLTNKRPLGNKTITQMDKVIDGYNIIMSVVGRFNKNLNTQEIV
jgi:hypothetical protein